MSTGYRDNESENETKRNRVRVGLVGYGYWGPNLARNLNELPGCELVAVADRDVDRRTAVRSRYRDALVVSDYTDFKSLELDAVVVATPPHTHHDVAGFCLEHGWHTLVEKPLTLASDDARRLSDLADAENRILMVGHTFEYNPVVTELKRLVSSSELGKLYYIDMTRVSLGIFQNHMNVMWDLAPHDLSILMHLLGEAPTQIAAHGRAFINPAVFDDVHMHVEFASGISAHIHVSWLSPKKIRQCTLVGSKRMAIFDDVDLFDKLRIYDKGVDVPPYTDTLEAFHYSYHYGNVITPHIPHQEPLRTQCEHFLDCIRTGKRPQTDAANGIRVIRALEAAEFSLQAGGIPVDMTAPALPVVA